MFNSSSALNSSFLGNEFIASLDRYLPSSSSLHLSINAAALIERWREDDEGKYLSKLAINSFPKNEEFNAEEELNNCLAQITKNFYNERINSLIKKQADNQLTSDEKVELKEIIHKNKIKR